MLQNISLYFQWPRWLPATPRELNATYAAGFLRAAEIGSHKDRIARWFRELEHYGFIVMVTGGGLGTEGRGKAPHWRLTEEDYLGRPPTRDFLLWNGRPFQQVKKQNPVPETRDSAAAHCPRNRGHIAGTPCPRNQGHN
ncbi:MAG: hypothetical protein WBD83_24350 [Xanthobacteraceae bacterium]